VTAHLDRLRNTTDTKLGDFWVYWVSALGAVAFTSVVTFILDRALDDEAKWTLAPIRYLKFWGSPSDRKPGPIHRKGTGLYDLVRR